MSDRSSAKEVSPWLQLTPWPSYLQGYKLKEVAVLLLPPNREVKSLLATRADSFEPTVNDAYLSVCNASIQDFYQLHINSFLSRPRAADRPLLVKLQKSNWRQYIKIWKALLLFLYCTTRPDQSIVFRHQLTVRQAACLEDVIECGQHMAHPPMDRIEGVEKTISSLKRAKTDLSKSCLVLYISLLDHDIRGASISVDYDGLQFYVPASHDTLPD